MMIAATVMAHPNRQDRAEALASVLENDFPTRIIYDPDPDGPSLTIPTARLAWKPWKSNATHHLLLQDDAQLVPFFASSVREIVAKNPDRWVSLFTEWGSKTSWACRVALLANASFAPVVDRYIPTLGLIVPAHEADGLSRWLHDVDETMDDDHALHDYTREHIKKPPIAAIPNLIQHGAATSLLGNDEVLGSRKATMLAPADPPQGWWDGPEFTDAKGLPLLMYWKPDSPQVLLGPGLRGHDYHTLSYSDEVVNQIRQEFVSSSIRLSTSAITPFLLLCLCLDRAREFAVAHHDWSDPISQQYFEKLRLEAVSGAILGALRRVLDRTDMDQMGNLADFAGRYVETDS